VFAKAKAEGANAVVVSAAIESELVGMDDAERLEFLAELGLTETGLARVIRAGYDLLHLITFFTVGPKEARAWTVERGAKAPQAAGAIHSDFERGFIRAETIAFDDYVALGGEAGARDAGKLRQEGKEYVVAGRRRPALQVQRLSAVFPPEGSGLERYSAVLPCAEINSSFHRSHRASTWEKWRDSVPANFRFAVKLPKTVTHEARLAGVSTCSTPSLPKQGC
jgi:hypothetical protein